MEKSTDVKVTHYEKPYFSMVNILKNNGYSAATIIGISLENLASER